MVACSRWERSSLCKSTGALLMKANYNIRAKCNVGQQMALVRIETLNIEFGGDPVLCTGNVVPWRAHAYVREQSIRHIRKKPKQRHQSWYTKSQPNLVPNMHRVCRCVNLRIVLESSLSHPTTKETYLQVLMPPCLRVGSNNRAQREDWQRNESDFRIWLWQLRNWRIFTDWGLRSDTSSESSCWQLICTMVRNQVAGQAWEL